MYKGVTLVALIGLLAWAYQALCPPSPRLCGTPNGPPIIGPRIKLRDGRHLAYFEQGVPRELAKHKIIFIHGFASTKHDTLNISSLPQELVEEQGVYLVSFDRPGYGESDPDPKRTPKSLALDVEELADQLGLGSKFFVIGFSMGGEAVWGCLNYIPNRLAGATLLAPVANYWWSGFPPDLWTEAYYQQLPQDQWTLRVTHYIPWLTYWWNTQKLFPASGVASKNPKVFSNQDLQLLSKISGQQRQLGESMAMQQGEFESLHRDLMVGFGKWEFSPLAIENPFPNNESAVHLWHGDDDQIVPVSLQRFIIKTHPWIHYHQVPGSGHLFPFIPQMTEAIIRTLLHGSISKNE